MVKGRRGRPSKILIPNGNQMIPRSSKDIESEVDSDFEDADTDVLSSTKRERSFDDCRAVCPSKRGRMVEITEKSKSQDLQEQTSKAAKHVSLKEIPKFSGAIGEDVLLWVDQSKFFLSMHSLKENEKFDLIKLSLSGDARYIIIGRQDIKNVEDIYIILINAFRPKTSPMTLLLNTKQKPDEPISFFAARLKANLQASGIQANTSQYEDMLLHLFLTQVKPEVSRRLKIWGPESFEKALNAAIQYEEDSRYIKKRKD